MRTRRTTLLLALALCVLPLRAKEGMSLDVPRSEGEFVRVIIRYRDIPLDARRGGAPATTAFQSATDDVERAGAKVERRFTRLLSGVSATVRRSDLDAIRSLPGVASVHRDRRVHATLSQSVPATRADQVWQSYGTRGQGKTVAILDTGVDWQHEAFGNGFGPGHRVTGGWDFVHNDADPDDDNGHGTHVAGIVGANGGGLTGVAPDVSLLAYKVLDVDGDGDSSNVIAALERAVAEHADVINLSLGSPEDADEEDPLVEAVQNAVAAGCVVVASAGNSGTFYTVGTPGVAPSALTVGAIDRQNAVAGFSSRGPTRNHLVPKPEIVAPGVGIVSAKANGGTTALSGTSMAAPHVAGIAALVRAIHPQWTPSEVKSALVSNAVPLGNELVVEGAGRVDAMAAAGATLFAAPSIVGFGITSGLPVKWTSTVTVSLTNRAATQKVFSLDVAGERAGVDLNAPSTITLAANQTRQIAVRLDVDNALLPAPTRGSLTFAGIITVRSGSTAIRLPWMFVKAATVTLDWQSEGEYGGIITGATFVTRFIGVDAGKTKFFVPATDFDLAVASVDEEGGEYVVLFTDQKADGNPVIAASRALATNTVTTATVDHRGAPLEPVRDEADGGGPSLTAKCVQHIVFKLEGRALDHIRRQYTARRLKINDVLAKPVLLFDGCADPLTHALYTVDRTVALPLDRDLTVTNTASEYASTPLRIAMPEPYATLTAGLVIRESGGGLGYSSFQVRSHTAEPFWYGTMYMTAPVDPVFSGVMSVGSSPLQGPSVMDSLMMRREGSRVVTGMALTPAPGEFSVAAGERIALGDGPLYPVSLTAASTSRGFFSSFHEWRGLHGEYYRQDLVDNHVELYDEAGTLIRSANYMCCAAVPPGFYRVVGTAALRTPRGVDRSTVIATLDSRRADTVPPSLHTVRIVDAEGRFTRHLRGGGALLFSLQDTILEETLENPSVRMPFDRVTVAWRRHGTPDWIAATPVLTADDQGDDEVLGHQETGVHYRVDLADALAVPGLTDLRISFADEAGNTTEWIGESVFTSSQAKTRAVRK
ncbi:MAG TPA: S8 family serine peptidase [Thermoanaerobaculia bacterium]|nr:S8 family serine peptidase [Thermoanaerobaculia bacterium]